MKRLFAYYDIPATLRIPSQSKPWPEWPHVYLANLQLNEAAVQAFTSNFGKFSVYGKRPVSESDLKRAQESLRDLWDMSQTPDANIGRMGAVEWPLEVHISAKGEIELYAGDCWTFAYLAFLRDAAKGHTKICAYADCDGTRYFISPSKRPKVFCSHRCAVRANNARIQAARTKGRRHAGR